MAGWESDSIASNIVQPNYEYNLNQNESLPSYSFNNQRDNRQQSDYNGGGRRSNGRRNYDYSESINAPIDSIGIIIGKGGSNIQRLQSIYNVHVNLDKANGIVTVFGNNDVDVKSALNYIREQINKSNRGLQGSSNLDSGATSYYEDNNQNPSGSIDWVAVKDAEERERQYWAKNHPLIKNIYKEYRQVANLSKEEVERIRLANGKTTVARAFKPRDGTSDNIPNPVWKFEQCFAAYPDLMDELFKQGFKKPLALQAQCWPILLKGEDMIAISQTGTGKTLTYVLPAFIHRECQSNPCSKKRGANVLIMVPTRELGRQIEKVINSYQFKKMKAACIYVSGDHRKRINSVESDVDIIICTPDHLDDLRKMKAIDIYKISYVVLDEFDRMLDMGFELQIRKILLHIRPDRQTVITSTTWPAGVRRLAEKYLVNPIKVCLESMDSAVTHTVRQLVEIVKEDDKFHIVTNFLRKMKSNEKVIIFCDRKSKIFNLHADLSNVGQYCECIYDSKKECEREQIIDNMISGEVKILLGTDYASRAIDIEDITHVINYDFPHNIEEYVFRVNRTGRAGRQGTVISYLTHGDCDMAPELIPILDKSNQRIPYELRYLADFSEKEKKRKRVEKSMRKVMRAQLSGGEGGHRRNRH